MIVSRRASTIHDILYEHGSVLQCERFSSYLPNLKQSRIESSFTDSLIDEKIVAIDDWSLEFRTCLGVPFELSLRPKTIRLYFLSLPLLKLTLPLF